MGLGGDLSQGHPLLHDHPPVPQILTWGPTPPERNPLGRRSRHVVRGRQPPGCSREGPAYHPPQPSRRWKALGVSEADVPGVVFGGAVAQDAVRLDSTPHVTAL
jgi:hypothetical protein